MDTEMCCPKGKCGCQYFIVSFAKVTRYRSFCLIFVGEDIYRHVLLGDTISCNGTERNGTKRNGMISFLVLVITIGVSLFQETKLFRFVSFLFCILAFRFVF